MAEARSPITPSGTGMNCNGINNNMGSPGGTAMGTLWYNSLGSKESSPRGVFQNGFHSPKASDFPHFKDPWIRSPPGSPLVNVGNFTSDNVMGHPSPGTLNALPPCSIGGVPGIKEPLPPALCGPWRFTLHAMGSHEAVSLPQDDVPGQAFENRSADHCTSVPTGFMKYELSPDCEANVQARRLQMTSGSTEPASDYCFQRMKLPRYQFTCEDDAYLDVETTPESPCPAHGKKRGRKKASDTGEVRKKRATKRRGKDRSVSKKKKSDPDGTDHQQGSESQPKVDRLRLKYSTAPPTPSNGIQNGGWIPTSQLGNGVPQPQRFFPFNYWQPDYSIHPGLLKSSDYPRRLPQKPYHAQAQDLAGNAIPGVGSFAQSLEFQERLAGNDKVPMHYGQAPFEGKSIETYVIQRPGSCIASPQCITNLTTSSQFASSESHIPGSNYQLQPPSPYQIFNGGYDASMYNAYFGVMPPYPPIAPDPYYWLRDPKPTRAALHPTFIKPKPSVYEPQPYGAYPYNRQGCGYVWQYPNVADMFHNARLVPSNNSEQKMDSNPNPTTLVSSSDEGPAVNVSATWQTVSTSPHYENNPSAVPSACSAEQSYADDCTAQVPNDSNLSSCDGPSLSGLSANTTQETHVNITRAFQSILTADNGDRSDSAKVASSKNHKARRLDAKRRPSSENICSVCGKKYARAFTLKTHMRVHTGEKPFKCPICERPFAQASGLEAHKRVHTGEKPYQCKVCERGFSHSSAVKSHMRTHTGEKPFACRTCDKSFADQSTVKKHERTHTGLKPFTCKECGMRFTQTGNMNKHLKNIHGLFAHRHVNEALSALAC